MLHKTQQGIDEAFERSRRQSRERHREHRAASQKRRELARWLLLGGFLVALTGLILLIVLL